MAYARIVHHWNDETATSMEIGDDQPGHPDLLVELTGRVLAMWRECVGAAVVEDDGEA